MERYYNTNRYWMLMFTTSNVNRSGGSALIGFGVGPDPSLICRVPHLRIQIQQELA